MSDVNKILKQSQAVFEAWQQQSVAERAALLELWAQLLSRRSDAHNKSAAMIRFQCQQALGLIAEEQELQGPTGESNHLYCVGRGSMLVLGDETANEVAMVGQISAALVAGNTVICSINPQAECDLDLLLSDLLKAGCPNRVAISLPPEQNQAMAEQPAIAAVVISGTEQNCKHYAQLLAQREGQLAQIICETDMFELKQLSEPHYLLRFITERTRTINITAIGGNAKLLELGSGE
ncbi:hypothetical protein [Agarivorans sp. QJM3NY_33]|uniref:hypothetical protein n=1 Tax=Agarivorans sp. QJM3NY_33 TaxID=3421432 RepID=UPI003D7DF006